MAASTAQIATELYQLSTARQDAETEHRRRVTELDAMAQSLLGSISDTDLDDPTLRAAVVNLPGGGVARFQLLQDFSRRVRNGEFDMSYHHVPVPVRTADDENGRERYELQTPMIPTLHSAPSFRRGPDGVRRPDPATIERLEAVVEKLCEGTGMVALNLDAGDNLEETIVRGPDGTWEHRGPAPYGVLQHRGSLYDAIRWFHRTSVAVEDGENDKAWHAPGEDLSKSLSEGCQLFWPDSGQRP